MISFEDGFKFLVQASGGTHKEKQAVTHVFIAHQIWPALDILTLVLDLPALPQESDCGPVWVLLSYVWWLAHAPSNICGVTLARVKGKYIFALPVLKNESTTSTHLDATDPVFVVKTMLIWHLALDPHVSLASYLRYENTPEPVCNVQKIYMQLARLFKVNKKMHNPNSTQTPKQP